MAPLSTSITTLLRKFPKRYRRMKAEVCNYSFRFVFYWNESANVAWRCNKVNPLKQGGTPATKRNPRSETEGAVRG